MSWQTPLPFLKNIPANAASETTSAYPGLASSSQQASLSTLWHLDELTEGSLATDGIDLADASGQGNHGAIFKQGSGWQDLYVGTPFRLLGRGIDVNAGGWVASVLQQTSPTAFSLAMWLKTTSQSGGRIFGFSSSQTGITADQNNQVDRHLYLNNSGQLAFGIAKGGSATPSTTTVGNGATVQVLAGGQRVLRGPVALAVNDSAWHHLAATLGSAGATLYLDGNVVVTDAGAASPPTYSGYWRLGGEAIHSSLWPDPGNSNWATGSLDEVAIWGRALGAQEVAQLWRRGANRILLQVRACQQALCADSPSWQGPDGTAQSYFSELNNSGVAAPSLAFSAFSSLPTPTGRYFQYRAILESDDTKGLCTYGGGAQNCSPELGAVAAATTLTYDTAGSLVQAQGGQPYYSLTSFSQTLDSGGCPGGVTYALSADGSNYYYYSGSAWAPSSGAAQSSSAAQLTNAVMAQFPLQAGTTALRAYLWSNGSQNCFLKSVAIGVTQ